MNEETKFSSPRQNPLTLIMKVKSPEDLIALKTKLGRFTSLPDDQNPIVKALNTIGTVHFARFAFMENSTRFAIITEFDGPMDKYLQDFASHIGPIFDSIHSHVVDGPPAPVQEHPQEFLDFVNANSATVVSFYCAYPELSVLDILAATKDS